MMFINFMLRIKKNDKKIIKNKKKLYKYKKKGIIQCSIYKVYKCSQNKSGGKSNDKERFY